MRRVLGWIDSFLDRIFCLIGAFLFLQLPLFIHEYTLVLKGHVDELSFHIQLIKDAAAQSNKSIEEYIHKFIESGDLDFNRQGEIMKMLTMRLKEMTFSLNALQDASVWTRPFVFMENYQADIGNATLSLFQFGLPLSLEGIVYAVVGLVVGYCVYHILTSLFRGRKTNVVGSQ